MKYRRSLTGKKYSIVASGLLVTILVLSLISQVVNQHLLSASKNNNKASVNGNKPSSQAHGNPVTTTNTANACHGNQTKCAHPRSHQFPLNVHASKAKLIHKPTNASDFTPGKNSTLGVPFVKIKKHILSDKNHIVTPNLRNTTNIHLLLNPVNSSRTQTSNYTKSDNNTSNQTTKAINSSITATEGPFPLKCPQQGIKVESQRDGSMTCFVTNKNHESVELILECSGLDGTGIECDINRESSAARILVKEMSDTDFSVNAVTRPFPPVSPGIYPFSISVHCGSTTNSSTITACR
jgi:hypothetical protein